MQRTQEEALLVKCFLTDWGVRVENVTCSSAKPEKRLASLENVHQQWGT
jgi:hypothetical protein